MYPAGGISYEKVPTDSPMALCAAGLGKSGYLKLRTQEQGNKTGPLTANKPFPYWCCADLCAKKQFPTQSFALQNETSLNGN